MNEAAFALLEKVAGHAQARLRLLRHHNTDETVKAALAIEIADIEELLDRARHEQKGGA